MAYKRALIVDDSRAARQVLSRMLENFGLQVESLESAEAALDHLQTSQPDVIFMDHLMAGMDGLAAVRIIKANPRTAAIPVFMYTSQDSEAYLQQARALGALGVLSKTLRRQDVERVLRQLQLTTQDISAVAPVNFDTAPAAAGRRIHPLWLVIAPLLAVTLWLAYANYQLRERLFQYDLSKVTVVAKPADSASSISVEAATVSLASSNSSASSVVLHMVRHEVENVAYGDVPLAGARLDRLRSMLEVARTNAVKGVLRVEVFTGDFCLQGNSVDGYQVAAADTEITHCDLLGNPFADVLSVQQRQSAAFADFLDALNKLSGSQSGGATEIQLADGGRQLAVPYPAQSARLKAAEWNRSAARNNRVEFTLSVSE